jgi:hypothetical protein
MSTTIWPDADTLRRREALKAEAARQAAELKARQQAGEQRVGPWAPAARLTKPVARKKAKAAVAAFRRRA